MYLTVSPVQIIDESLEKYGKTETSASEPQHLCQTAGFAAAAWMMLPAPVSVINMSSGGGHKNILTTNVGRSLVCHPDLSQIFHILDGFTKCMCSKIPSLS